MKKLFLIGFCLAFTQGIMAQKHAADIAKDTISLNEIIFFKRRTLNAYQQTKPLASMDAFLENVPIATMIKRGGYAWEPTLNNMTSERLNVTIDGMQVFGACTDKMDPITAYVDVSNLEKITIHSGQSGSMYGNTIGGGIDLVINRAKFDNSGFKTNLDLGYETNGNQKATSVELGYSGKKIYANIDGSFRKSDNYDAGGNHEVLYSPFQKYNIAAKTGYKLSDKQSLNATIIYDKATDVGYPALAMDVSLAEALITSISHDYKSDATFIKSLETKLYFNTITHMMDDTKRADVPIHMDMPGWSDTYGFYSKANAQQGIHRWSAGINGFYNKSLASMTMYPNDSKQPLMFMYTWPDVRTSYLGIYLTDILNISPQKRISTTLRLGHHRNHIAKMTGLESLQIIYPQITASRNRFLPSISSNYILEKKNYTFSIGLGYGERAPSVSEGYGFFLFNSFDNFDYIGNPNLKNEQSLEGNFKINYRQKAFHSGLTLSYFHISNYIIGAIDSAISPMTIGANGIKTYTALPHATIFDAYLNTGYQISKRVGIQANIGYNYGRGSDSENLPLIKPFSYNFEARYSKPHFHAIATFGGHATQSRYSAFYGEDKTPGYGVLALNFGHIFYVNNARNKVVLKYGVENLFDKNYSTYADWNNIPRKGRNFYINLSFVIP